MSTTSAPSRGLTTSAVGRSSRRGWRRALPVGLLALVALWHGGVASATWSATGTGSGRGIARTMPAGSQPAASLSGSTVTVSWAATTIATGVSVAGGYTVSRIDGAYGDRNVVCSCPPVAAYAD